MPEVSPDMLTRLCKAPRKPVPFAMGLPSIIDLFSGCGGLSWGFKEEGFPFSGCIDSSGEAIRTLRANASAEVSKGAFFEAADIEACDFAKYATASRSGSIVIGGPPCQAYSRVGRGKLRSLGHDRHHLKDSRGRLYEEFLNFALGLDARAIVMENVIDAVTYGGENIPEAICEDLVGCGYKAGWSVLNSADFGVPQVRERVILIAIREDEGFIPEWPRPTHRPPSGFHVGTFGQLRTVIKGSSRYFDDPLGWEDALCEWVTVSEAFDDLPILRKNAKEPYPVRRINEELPYRTDPTNSFQRRMRLKNSGWKGTTGHIYRNTARDFEIFDRMLPGQNYIDASRIAEGLLEAACARNGIDPILNKTAYEQLRKKIVPPYDREKFDDKWKRLDPERPSRTVVAHLGVDTYSHIHPFEPRGISIREAARLQSFPDDFLFWGSTGDAYKQIGNAVPPLLSQAIARNLAKQFISQLKNKTQSIHVKS
jgi:DNA (cytosine-5)-methyltransferase 1